jgi:ATP synthase protein I
MSGNGKGAVTRSRVTRPARDPGAADPAARGRALGLSTGWTVFSYLIAGMAAYGLIGWLIGRAVHVEILFPLGMLLGLGISLGYVVYHFGRQESAGKPGKEITGDR